MKTIEKSYSIQAPVAAVWRALVDPAVIEQWGAGPARMDDQVGTAFQLWGGDIYGKNVESEPGKRLVQEWYAGDWPAPSIAAFTLREEAGGTKLDLLHTVVPDEEHESIAAGWDEYYLGPIKSLLER